MNVFMRCSTVVQQYFSRGLCFSIDSLVYLIQDAYLITTQACAFAQVLISYLTYVLAPATQRKIDGAFLYFTKVHLPANLYWE